MVWLPCSEWITCDTMRKYRNDSLINEHQSMYKKRAIYTTIQVLAPYSLQTIKGEWTAGQLSNNLSPFADVGWPPTTPGLVFSVRKQFSRRHNASSHCCCSGLHLKKVSTIGPLHQRCRAVASLPTLTTTSEFLQTWLSAAGTITFKLFDAPLHKSSAANSTIFASVGRR